MGIDSDFLFKVWGLKSRVSVYTCNYIVTSSLHHLFIRPPHLHSCVLQDRLPAIEWAKLKLVKVSSVSTVAFLTYLPG